MRIDLIMVGRIRSIAVETFVNATEDREKVIQAIFNLIGEGEEEWISSALAEGSFGNPIEILTVEIKRKKDVERCFDMISRANHYIRSLEELSNRLDDRLVYHLRMDKASCYEGNPILWSKGESIVMRINVQTYPSSREEAIAILTSRRGVAGKDIIH